MDRVTVAEAAERLGVTQSAIRQRVRRGTMRHDKDPDGRVYVYLDPSGTAGAATYRKSRDELVYALRDQIEMLKVELADWKVEARRNDHVLATALERFPGRVEPPSREQNAPPVVPDSDEEEITAQDVESLPDSEEEAKKAVTARALEPVDDAEAVKADILREVVSAMTQRKLPLWQYIVGIMLSLLTLWWDLAWEANLLGGGLVLERAITALPLGTLVPLVFGFWVGLAQRLQRVQWRTVSAVALILGVGSLVTVLPLSAMPGILDVGGLYLVPRFGIAPVLLFVSGAFGGNALQRQAFGVQRRALGVDDSVQEAAVGTERLTPRQQAILSFAGVVLSALIPALAQVFTAG